MQSLQFPGSKVTILASAAIPPIEGEAPEITAARKPSLPSIDLLAYTGGKMSLEGFYSPVVIDLSSIKAQTPIPILRDHSREKIVGHADSVNISTSSFSLKGRLSGEGAHVDEIVALAGKDFPWQVSIGGNPTKVQYVERGQSVVANGQTFDGPFILAHGVEIREVSILPVGADKNTTATIAANSPPPTPVFLPTQSTTIDTFSSFQLEATRIDSIKAIGVKHKDDGTIILKAINEKWTPEQTEVHIIQSQRPTINVVTGGKDMDRAELLMVAALQSTKLANIDNAFKPDVLEAAHKEFKSRISLQQLFIEAAMAAQPTGRYTNFRTNARDIIRAAFSTKSISGILSNVANKYMVLGYNSVEQSWREISRIRSVPDFKTNTGYRGVTAFVFEEVNNMGEIPHGTMSEQSYTNKADTYGKMFAITRQDMYNDDLTILSELPRQMGRGGALKLNKVFWGAFLNNSAFFVSGNVNVSTGVLGIAGLNAANAVFKNLKDPEGEFVGADPAILLVPTALETTALQLYRDTTVIGALTAAAPNSNPFTGKFKPVSSRYLSDSTLGGTYSAVAYYLLANPADVPVIEVAFLDGQENPIVEDAEADFNTLGIQMRGYFDFGVSLQDFNGGVRSTGA